MCAPGGPENVGIVAAQTEPPEGYFGANRKGTGLTARGPKPSVELRLLERRTHRSGKDTVDHPRGGHDDHANVACGVLREFSNYLGYNTNYAQWLYGDDADPYGAESRRRLRLAAYLNSGGRVRL